MPSDRPYPHSLAQLHQRVQTLLADLSVGADSTEKARVGSIETTLEQLATLEEEVATQNAQLAAARLAVEQERARYHDLFELAPDPYLLTDSNGLICEANSAAATLFGIERRFLLGKPLQVFIPAKERQEFRRRVIDMESGEGANEWRLRMQPRGGSTIWQISATVVPVRSSFGEVRGFRWALRDISHRVQEEEQLRNLNAELERRVSERTEALAMANRAKDELLARERVSRETAEAANAAKDEFLATLSHELRTPLNVVLGLIFRLTQSPAMAGERKTIETIARNARELSHMVEDLIDTARITSGRFSLRMKAVDFSAVVQEAVDSVAATAGARTIRIETTFAPGLEVNADPERMRQVAWNLLVNALKFTLEGGHVTVRTAQDEGRATLTVADTGIGISRQMMGHIFERFWQGEPSTSRQPGGLGLGLAIVKQLVEMHGGTIEAVSEGPGLGSTFNVRLPLHAHGSPLPAAPASDATGG